MSRHRRTALWASLLLAGAGTHGSDARAAELTLTAQAVAAHGEFLTQAPPPPTQGVLCLVDSGVDVNPDTESMLLGRESIFGGTPDDVTSYHHGTYVAMVAGAAVNGWGMVGAWPRLKVFSTRVLPEGTEQLSSDAYRAGIMRCVRAKLAGEFDVRAVELALGGPADGRTAEELAQIDDAVSFARQNGLVVLSAAGNDAGRVSVPASLPNVIAVGAGTRQGSLCSFSSRGPELDVVAPGCEMDVVTAPDGLPATGQSSSLASAYAAGVVVALRSYRPDLSVEAVETLLRSAASPVHGRLDVALLFRQAGLAAIVDAYVPPAPTPVGSPISATCDPKVRICALPKVVSVRRRASRVIIRVASVPRGTRVAVRLDGRLRARTRSRIVSLRVRRFRTITIRYEKRGLLPSEKVRIRRAQVRPR